MTFVEYLDFAKTHLNHGQGLDIILYGGRASDVGLLSTYGNVLLWFTREEDAKSVPPKQIYTIIYKPIYDALYVIMGGDAVGGRPIEKGIMDILRNSDNRVKTVILHGYPQFIDVGLNVSKKVYNGGCVVSIGDDRINTLQDIARLLRPDLEAVVPIPLNSVETLVNEVPDISSLVAYQHLAFPIRNLLASSGTAQIPATMDMPVDVIDIYKRDRHLPYNPTVHTSAVNWGQRKLLISEIEFVSEVIRRDITNGGDGQGFILVYIGAAPGSHIPYLLNLFAIYGISAHLWDKIENIDKITIGAGGERINPEIEIAPERFRDPTMHGETAGFFTDYVANQYLNAYGTSNRLLFVSDIRVSAREESIISDMSMQRRWVEIMQPFGSLLKMRLPYPISGAQPEYVYLDGDIYTQAWSRNKSSESRLMSFKPYGQKGYNIFDYDASFSYFNTYTRMESYDMSIVVSGVARSHGKDVQGTIPRHIQAPNTGLCTCHDCAREIQVLAKYLAVLNFPISDADLTALVDQNTLNCRPYTQQETNTRTLWNRVNVKVSPSDRDNVVFLLNHQYEGNPFSNIVVDGIPTRLWRGPFESMYDIMPSIGTIVVADDLAPIDVERILINKRPGIPYIDGVSGEKPMNIMRMVLTGQRFPVAVNFHSDFVPEYNPTRDRGKTGIVQMGLFLQDLRLAHRNDPVLDFHRMILLYVLTRIHIGN